MLALKFSERRQADRKQCTGVLPGKITTQLGQPLELRPLDVSEKGFGFTATRNLQVGSLLFLHTRDQVIELEIGWKKPGLGKKDEKRYGAICKDPSINLEKIFVEAGCLMYTEAN